MKRILALLLVLGIVFSTSGTTTLLWPDATLFKFSEGTATSHSTVQNPESYDISMEPWNKPAWCTNHIDMGKVSLESMTTPPTLGYNDDVHGFMDCTEIIEGHAYWIKTRDGKYAKVKVKEAKFIGLGPDGNINRVVFEWEYLGEGKTSTPKTPGDGTENPCPLSIGFAALASASLFIFKR
ncbi:MAG: hypothetical protein ABII22_05695 [Candidatus Micrarchaeota archaeon]